MGCPLVDPGTTRPKHGAVLVVWRDRGSMYWYLTHPWLVLPRSGEALRRCFGDVDAGKGEGVGKVGVWSWGWWWRVLMTRGP